MTFAPLGAWTADSNSVSSLSRPGLRRLLSSLIGRDYYALKGNSQQNPQHSLFSYGGYFRHDPSRLHWEDEKLCSFFQGFSGTQPGVRGGFGGSTNPTTVPLPLLPLILSIISSLDSAKHEESNIFQKEGGSDCCRGGGRSNESCHLQGTAAEKLLLEPRTTYLTTEARSSQTIMMMPSGGGWPPSTLSFGTIDKIHDGAPTPLVLLTNDLRQTCRTFTAHWLKIAGLDPQPCTIFKVKTQYRTGFWIGNALTHPEPLKTKTLPSHF